MENKNVPLGTNKTTIVQNKVPKSKSHKTGLFLIIGPIIGIIVALTGMVIVNLISTSLGVKSESPSIASIGYNVLSWLFSIIGVISVIGLVIGIPTGIVFLARGKNIEDEVASTTMPSQVKYAGFWIRLLALAIDCAIVGIISFLISLLFRNILLNLGENLWYIGFVITGLYFFIFNSNIGKGQTIGKKIVRIKVINESGESLTFVQSVLRFLPVGLILSYSGISLSLSELSGNSQIISVAFFAIITAIFLGIVAFIIFTKEKRGLHDFLVHSLVVKKREEIKIEQVETLTEAIRNHKKGFIITIGLFCVSVIGALLIPGFLINKISKDIDFNTMLNLKADLEKKFDISNVGIEAQINQSENESGQAVTEKNLIISGYLKYSEFNDENQKAQLYDEIDKEVTTNYPSVNNFDQIVISLRSGYNLGIANFSMTDNKVFNLRNGLFSNVSDDVAMLNTASTIAKQWDSDAQVDAVIMIADNRLTNSHVVYFSSKNKPGIIYHVGLDYNNQNVAGSDGEDSDANLQQNFGNIGYIGINDIKISSATAFQTAENYAKSKVKNPLTDYVNTFLLDYSKDFNANVWLYTLVNKTNTNDVFRVEIDASSGNIIGANQ